jgi:hypothetical protein
MALSSATISPRNKIVSAKDAATSGMLATVFN